MSYKFCAGVALGVFIGTVAPSFDEVFDVEGWGAEDVKTSFDSAAADIPIVDVELIKPAIDEARGDTYNDPKDAQACVNNTLLHYSQ